MKALRYVGLLPLLTFMTVACTEATPESEFFEIFNKTKANLLNLPASYNNLSSFSVDVSSSEVESYMYAYGPKNTTDCSSATYGSEIPVASSILVGTLGTEDQYRLCVIGKDYSGDWQDVADASEFVWTFDATGPSVSIEQATAQADPTNGVLIEYLATFSEPIDVSSISSSDFSTSPGSVYTSIDSISIVDSQNVKVYVRVLSTPDNLSVSSNLSASMVMDLAGNPNSASTSTDNLVYHDSVAPAPLITSPSSGSYVTSTSVVLSGSCEGASGSVSLVGDFVGSPVSATCTGSVFSKSVTLNSGDGLKNMSVSETDLAGNTGSSGHNLILDATAPTILNVTSLASDGAYTVSQTLSLVVKFSEPVSLSGGSPALTLETGTTDAVVAMTSINSDEVTFDYTVTVSDLSMDLDYQSISALAGGSFVDAAGNSASLVLPAVGSASSLSGQKNLKVIGSPANLVFSSSSYNFGPLATGNQFTSSMTITNTGGYLASGLSFTGLAAPFSYLSDNCGGSLAAGGSCNVNVKYLPMSVSAHGDTLDLNYNDGLGVQMASMDVNGTGVFNNSPQIYESMCFTKAYSGESYSCSAAASGISDPGESTTWSLQNNSCSWLSINPSSGSISGVPGSSDQPCSFEIQVSDAVNAPSSPWKVQVEVLSDVGVGDFSLGATHSCAIVDGVPKCWGDNNFYGLGRGFSGPAQDYHPMPVKESAGIDLSGAKSIKLGLNFSCARIYSGEVRCWGAGSYGQLGINATSNEYYASTSVFGITDAVDIAVGETHACALRSNGRVYCWGQGAAGKIGNMSVSNQTMAQMVVMAGSIPLDGAIAISSRKNHTCALMKDRKIMCWGQNILGSLGQDNTAPSSYNYAIDVLGYGFGMKQPLSLSVGGSHTCVNLVDGNLQCWGKNMNGNLGLGSSLHQGDGAGEMSALPNVNLGTTRTAKFFSAGLEHTCAGLDNGMLKCWGYNNNGQLGLGHMASMGDSPVETGDSLPTVSLPIGTLKSVKSGSMHTCAKIFNGQDDIFCWGQGSYDQLGTGSGTNIGDGGGEMGVNLIPVDLYAPLGPSGYPMFVTSGTYNGNLFSFGGPDIICQNHATAASLPNAGTYKAVIGGTTYGFTPNSVLSPAAGPIVNLMGEMIAPDFSQLFGTGSGISNFVKYDEYISQVPNLTKVWTGANTNGSSNNFDCLGWTDGGSGQSGRTGRAYDTNNGNLNLSISENTGTICSSMYRLYCVSTVPNP